MLGNDLVVAPVLDRNTTEWTVELPHGNWKHIWCTEGLSCPEITGPTSQKVTTEVGFPPVFYRPESLFAQAFASVATFYGTLPCNVPFEQDNSIEFDL